MDIQSFSDLYCTGIPSGFTAALALAGTQRRQLANTPKLIPSRVSAGVFGSAFALGTWMIYDGDYKNGAGFNAVWSTLYLMANRRSLGRGLYPSSLWGLAALNAVSYAIGFTHAKPAVQEINLQALEPEINVNTNTK